MIGTLALHANALHACRLAQSLRWLNVSNPVLMMHYAHTNEDHSV